MAESGKGMGTITSIFNNGQYTYRTPEAEIPDIQSNCGMTSGVV